MLDDECLFIYFDKEKERVLFQGGWGIKTGRYVSRS
jgi:hypothetical protein